MLLGCAVTVVADPANADMRACTITAPPPSVDEEAATVLHGAVVPD